MGPPATGTRLNLLAFDTSTEQLSVALQAAQGGRWEHSGAGGAEASGTLIPAIQGLLQQAGLTLGQLDAIAFGRGPGSFTGLRTACSVAQGLAYGAGVPVLPVDTLTLVAEAARASAGVTQVVAVLDARMGEVYWAQASFDAGRWMLDGEPRLGAPESVQAPPGWPLAGNACALYGERLPAGGARIEAWPTAAALLRLAPALLTAGQAGQAGQALPLYVRDKVAHTTAERAALRAAKDAGSKP
jgi:tRNA threonylcarbamoyladenosine biosynthesis protein TsaB